MMIDIANRPVYVSLGAPTLDATRASLVLLHGAGLDHTVWGLFTRAFGRARFNAIAVDLPGHGRSDGPALGSIEALAAWTVALIDGLALPNVVLVGHSMGALIAFETAALIGARATRTVLLGFGYPMQVGEPLLDAARENDPRAIDMMTLWGHDFGTQLGGNAVPGISVLNLFQRLLERAAPGVLHTDLRACHHYDNGAQAAAAMTAPVHMILGARDRMAPLRAAREFAATLLQPPQIDVIPHCGHCMLGEQPEATHRLLEAILATA